MSADTMGRGKSWTQEDVLILGEHLACGKTIQEISDLKGWSFDSTRSAARRLKKGIPFNRYKGRKHKIPGDVVAEELDRDPKMSVRKLQLRLRTEHGINCGWETVRSAMKVAFKPWRPERHQSLSETSKRMRLEWCKKTLLRIKMHEQGIRVRLRQKCGASPLKPLNLEKMVWEDEKIFRCVAMQNSQNTRIWVPKAEPTKSKFLKRPSAAADLLCKKRKIQNNPGVMCCALVCCKGVSAPVFVDPRTKVDARAYCKVLEELWPQMESWYNVRDCVFVPFTEIPISPPTLLSSFGFSVL